MSFSTRETIKRFYINLIRLMHRPLMKKEKEDPYHAVIREFITLSREDDSSSVLEIGSRNVTGVTRRNMFSHCGQYVGFDILGGDGVDVVGDVHELSRSFPLESFDYVYSISVFEHVLFPWKAVLEINKVMKVGGYVLVTSHPVWPPHELPWDFWRFPSGGFHALFNEYTGFEIISVAEGLPCSIYSLVQDAPAHDNCFYTLNQGVSVIARKAGDFRGDLLKWEVNASGVLETMYPNGEVNLSP
ncbi:methyltransferase domain-containing protein [Thiolapillus sp.]